MGVLAALEFWLRPKSLAGLGEHRILG